MGPPAGAAGGAARARARSGRPAGSTWRGSVELAEGAARRLGHVEVLLFDATGTLVTLRRGVGRVYAEVAADHGVLLDPAAVERAFATALRGAPPLAFPRLSRVARERAERAWWERIVRAAVTGGSAQGRPLGRQRFADLFEDLYARFARAAAWRPLPGARAVLAELEARGYLLAVLSNFDGRLAGLLAELGLARHLAAVTTSSELGVAKPEPRAFARALARLRRDAWPAAHVGDSPEVDARGAAAAGLLPILIRAPLPRGVEGVRIDRLPQLAELLPGVHRGARGPS